MSRYCRRRGFSSKDYQRKATYRGQWDLEDAWLESCGEPTELSWTEIVKLVHDVCDTYGVPENRRPRIKFNGRLRVTSRYLPLKNTIELARGWGSKSIIVLHEALHAVQYQLDIKDCWHGQFSLVFLWMGLSCFLALILTWFGRWPTSTAWMLSKIQKH